MKEDDVLKPFSEQALFRYTVVSLVRARLLAGEELSRAIEQVANMEHATASGGLRRVSTRSIQRWLLRYEEGGMGALENAPRTSCEASRVLDPKLLDFLAQERKADRKASIPEMLRRAKQKGLLASTSDVDRSTVFRALVRMHVATGRTKQERDRDMRRFAYAHRMQMVLADGKHFRVGAKCVRRVAIFFLDDATRRGLDVVVGPSESAQLFLRGLDRVLRAWGLMGILYLDHGPGFIANAVKQVMRRFEKALIHGEVRYPQGHGKIEKFNQNALNGVLRTLVNRPDVDPAFEALELRLRHWLFEIYNHLPHEGLTRIGGRFETPFERWNKDAVALQHTSQEAIRAAFVIYHMRTVSRDRIVSIQGTAYEVPLALSAGGRKGPRIQIEERVLDGTFHVFCPDGTRVRIHPVDLEANAHSRRAKREALDDEPDAITRSAADMAFDRDFGPVLDADGGVEDPETEPDSDAEPDSDPEGAPV